MLSLQALFDGTQLFLGKGAYLSGPDWWQLIHLSPCSCEIMASWMLRTPWQTWPKPHPSKPPFPNYLVHLLSDLRAHLGVNEPPFAGLELLEVYVIYHIVVLLHGTDCLDKVTKDLSMFDMAWELHGQGMEVSYLTHESWIIESIHCLIDHIV
jgi:hypothetical protein